MAQECRLARAREAEQGGDPLRLEGDGHVVEAEGAAEVLRHVLEPDVGVLGLAAEGVRVDGLGALVVVLVLVGHRAQPFALQASVLVTSQTLRMPA